MHHSQGIMIVEDEPLSAMTLEQMVEELGFRVAGCAGSESDAFALLNATNPCAAILDLRLGLHTSLAVAGACKDRGIPVVFATGFSPSEYGRFCEGQPVLKKPFSCDELAKVLSSLDVKSSSRPTSIRPLRG